MKVYRSAIWAVLVAVPVVSVDAVILDRIAATVDGVVITTSEIEQYQTMRIVPRRDDEEDFEYERRVLDHIIAGVLQVRDVQRFGVAEVTDQDVDEALERLVARFSSKEEFDAALERSDLTIQRVRLILGRELEVATFVQLRFSPMVFVSLEEIETYYRDVWVDERLASGRPLLPLAEVRDEIRQRLKSSRLADEVTRWLEDLKDRTNIDVYI